MSQSAEESGGKMLRADRAGANQNRLQLYFAILSALGGLVLATGEGAEHIPAVAVFFAVFGYVFVDSLKLFALPPIGAYMLMGIAAVYCVGDFWNLETPGNQQMLSVAQLLVFVQAILMLQKKSPRIFEQLGVFCLLELVVAAVFNDAFIYGLILVPIGLIGVWALVLLSSVTVVEDLDGVLQPRPQTAVGTKREHSSDGWLTGPASAPPRQSAGIRFLAADSVASLAGGAAGMGRYAVLTLGPAIILVAAFFFYAIPRTTDAARMERRGNALVGFDDQLQLGQIGKMLQSSAPALRVQLTDRQSGRPYIVTDGLYLRGQVLERYEPRIAERNATATWKSVSAGARSRRLPLPSEYVPARPSHRNFYDTVLAEITCAATTSPALFTIAPHFHIKTENNVLHSGGRWLLCRRQNPDFLYPRIRYHFGTNAFQDGVQTDMIAEAPQYRSTLVNSESGIPADRSIRIRQTQSGFQGYLNRVLAIDEQAMPTVARIARRIRESIPPDVRTDLKVAEAMQRHLASEGGYEYTLNLNAVALPGVDPIEQFMSVDRRGHCQYFASALTMMLRSVNIPARIVVGYHTDNFNEVGQYYLARQSDAHAWVEALLSRDQLGLNRLVYGQPPADLYWVRLDPTPGDRGGGQPSARGVGQVLNLAQDLWEEYVVEMDGDRQQRVLTGGETLSGPYGSVIAWIRKQIAAIRAGGLGGGSLARRNIFSWPAALITGILAAVLFFLLKVRPPRWVRGQISGKSVVTAGTPAVSFYAEMLKQLERLGITRTAAQTPTEFLHHAELHLQHIPLQRSGDAQIIHPLRFLTKEFCRARYGLDQRPHPDVNPALSQVTSHVNALLSRPKRDHVKQSLTTERL